MAPVSPRGRRRDGDSAVGSLLGLFVPPNAAGAAPPSPATPPPSRPPPQLKKAGVTCTTIIAHQWFFFSNIFFFLFRLIRNSVRHCSRVYLFASTAGDSKSASSSPSPAAGKKAAPKKIDPKHRCKICEQEVITHVFLPCGHKAACEVCATDWLRTLGTCRVCLAPAQGVAPLPGSASSSASPSPVTPAGPTASASVPSSPVTTPAAAGVHQTSSLPALTGVHGAGASGKSAATASPSPVAAMAATSATSSPATPAAAAAATSSGPTALQKKVGQLTRYASLRQRGLATFLLETGQEGQLAQVDTIDLSAPKGDEGKTETKEVDLAQNFEEFSEVRGGRYDIYIYIY